MFKKLNKKGFTLAELLIVVAIIGVLVAISIPIFTGQLEKAREGVDESNLRSLYAVASAAMLTEDTSYKGGQTDGVDGIKGATLEVTKSGEVVTAVATLKLTQLEDKLKGKDSIDIGGITVNSDAFHKEGTMTITLTSDGSTRTITGAAKA